MKRFGKIVVLLLALAVLVCAFVLVSSAEGEKNTTSPYIVDGTYYDYWTPAVNASKTAKDNAIYLNPDYVDPAIGIAGVIQIEPKYYGSGAEKPTAESTTMYWWSKANITLDLNGCTLSVINSRDPLINIKNAVNFTIRGEGTLDGIVALVRTTAESQRTTVNLIGAGKGITINLRKLESDTVNTHGAIDALNVNLFNFTTSGTGEFGTDLNISGRITVNPYNIHTTNIFALGSNSTLNANGATVIVNVPKSELQKKMIGNSKPGGGFMFSIGQGSTANITDSHFEYNHGSMFSCGGSGTKLTFVQDAETGAITSGDPSLQKAGDPKTFINAKDSTFIAREGYYIDRTSFTLVNNYYSVGYVILAGTSPLLATFEDCDIVGAHRAFTASNSYRSDATSSKIAPARVIMKNTNYTTSDDIIQGSPWLAGDGINLKWLGGNIHAKSPTVKRVSEVTTDPGYDVVASINIWNTTSLFGFSLEYGELADNGNTYDDDWYGIYLNNVLFYANPSASSPIPGKGGYKLGGAVEEVTVYPNGDKNASFKGYWAGTDEFVNDPFPAFYSLSNIVAAKTTDFSGTTNGTGKGSYGLGDSIGAPKRAGILRRINDGQDAFIRFEYYDTTEAVAGTAGGPYLDLQLCGSSVASTTAPANQAAVEAARLTTAANSYLNKYIVYEFDIATSTGSWTKTSISTMNRGALLGANSTGYTINPNQSIGSGSYAGISPEGIFTAGSETRQLPTDGTWSRVSIIWEIKYTDTTTTVNNVTYPAYDFSGTKAYVYLNGERLSTLSCVNNTPVIKNLAGAFAIDSVRCWLYPTLGKASDICFDNLRLSRYNDENAVIKQAIETGCNINGLSEFNVMPDNNAYVAATVDGIKYGTMDEALKAMKPGSTISINEDIDEIINVDSPILIITNRNKIKGFASSDFVAFEGDGYIGFDQASKNQIFNVSYKADTPAIDESETLTEGSTLTYPGAADVNNYPDVIEGNFFVDWTLVDGERVTVVSSKYASNGAITAYPVFEGAAVVEWYDNEGNLLHTENYKPGDGVLSAVYTPTVDIPGVTTAHAWFDLAYKGYSAIELPTSGTYKVYPDMEPTAKSAMPANIKLNLTLFTNYELNIFVPLTNLPEEIAKDSIRVVRVSGANNEQAVGSLGECTVYSEPYIKFGGDKYGVADTSINTYRIYYKADGVELYKELSYGVPYYASAVMQQSSNNEARTLVMNMVNYASKVIAGLSVDKTGDRGAEIYNALLEKEEFAALVRTYDDSAFLENGAIWNADIKNLTYDDVIADDPETTEFDESLKSPSKWIAGGGFYFSTNQPRFFIKFSGAAEMTANGIKKPTTSGGYGWANPGLFGYIAMTGETVRPGKLYARYDDTGADAYLDWNNKDKSGNITYYLVGTSYDAKNPFHLYNMAEPLSVKLNSHSGPNDSSAVYYPDQGDDITFTYSLAAYIGEMITKANNETLSTQERAEYRAAADMAKALYAYAKVTREFVY